MIARLEVTRGTLTEYPLAERTKNGWQNGSTFYSDAGVTKVTPVIVRSETSTHDDSCEAEYVVGATGYTDCGCSDRARGEQSDAQVLETFLGKLAGDGAYTLDFSSAANLHDHIVRLLKRDIAALRAASAVTEQGEAENR